MTINGWTTLLASTLQWIGLLLAAILIGRHFGADIGIATGSAIYAVMPFYRAKDLV